MRSVTEVSVINLSQPIQTYTLTLSPSLFLSLSLGGTQEEFYHGLQNDISLIHQKV